MRHAAALSIILALLTGSVVAQDANWNATADKQHNMAYAQLGLDYGTTVRLGYARLLGASIPTLLCIDFSTPMGEVVFDDFEIRLGSKLRIMELRNFILGAEFFGSSRRSASNMVAATGLGAEASVIAGYYRPMWHVAGEYGYDKTICTYLKNSDDMRQYVYSDIRDGWYSTTGGNFHYGMQGSKSIGTMIDITARGGLISAEWKDEDPMLPFYTQLGCIVRF